MAYDKYRFRLSGTGEHGVWFTLEIVSCVYYPYMECCGIYQLIDKNTYVPPKKNIRTAPPEGKTLVASSTSGRLVL